MHISTRKFLHLNGFEYKDGKYYLSKEITFDFQDKKACKKRKRTMKLFDYDKWVIIAWEIGVSNPEGININNFNGHSEEGSKIFVGKWKGINSNILVDRIWDRLCEINESLKT